MEGTWVASVVTPVLVRGATAGDVVQVQGAVGIVFQMTDGIS